MRPIDQQLLQACQTGDIHTAQTLLQQGANPNTKDRDGFTPFMTAAKKGDTPILQRLIQHGANPHTTDLLDRNALYHAVGNCQYDTTQYLITQLQFDPNTQYRFGTTAFMRAAEKADVNMLKILYQLGANPHITDHCDQNALYHAVRNHQYDNVEYLITQLQLNPNTQDKNGITPFMIATQKGDIKMLNLLLQLGANPSTTDHQGRNALHYAVDYRHHDTAQYLITPLHLNPNTQDKNGITPFMIAARNGDIKMLQLLLQLGANPYTTNRYGRTALHYAVDYRHHDTAQYLITPLHLNPNTQDKNGITPFMIAVQNGDIKMLQLLLQLGANPYTTNRYGRTALHYAKDPQTAHFLISALHLNPNIQDHHGNTPLLITRQNRNTHTAKTLIQLGAHPNIPNHQGQKPTTITQTKRTPLRTPQPSTITL